MKGAATRETNSIYFSRSEKS